MRAVVQRVTSASVTVDGRVAGKIRRGSARLARRQPDGQSRSGGISRRENRKSAIFSDQAGKMNLSLLDAGGSALVVSQFTLYGDTRGGGGLLTFKPRRLRKPAGFTRSLSGRLRAIGVTVETGVFQAHMQVELVNDGPVTILLDSEKTI